MDGDNGEPTKEFLAELLWRARVYGWDSDYEEIVSFVRALHRQAGVELTTDQARPFEEAELPEWARRAGFAKAIKMPVEK